MTTPPALTQEELDTAADGYPPEAFNARARADIMALRTQLAVEREQYELLRAGYRRLYSFWLRVAHAMTPAGGPDITDEEVADRAETIGREWNAIRADRDRWREHCESDGACPAGDMEAERERDELRAERERLRRAIDDTLSLARRLFEMAEQGAGFRGHWGERVLQAVEPLARLPEVGGEGWR